MAKSERKAEKLKPKVKITLTLPRGTVAVLERIRAKRLQRGAMRSESGPSVLVEEAIRLLRAQERL